MQHTMVLSDEELEVMEELLHNDLAQSRTELRHTDSRDYRDRIRRRVELEEWILQKVDVAMSSSEECYSGEADASY